MSSPQSITSSSAAVTTTAAAAASTASRSILGPLTTTYTPSGICTNYGGSTNDFVAFQAQGCNGGVLQDTSSCWPPATTPAPNPPYLTWGFYSPGTLCPSGYYSACGSGFASEASVTSSIPEHNFQYPLIAGETAVGCCPNGFTCSSEFSRSVQTCAYTVTSGSYLAGYCPVTNAAVTDSLTSFQYITIPGTNTITFATGTVTDTLTGTLTTAVLFAPLFQINWQSSDSPLPTTTTLTSSSPTSVNLAPTPPPAVTITATPTTTPGTSSGLSTGAKAAIGVVIPVVVLIAAVLGVWLLRRRRRRSGGRLAEGGPGGPGTPADTVATSQVQEHFAPAKEPTMRSELDTPSRRQEMETPRPELAGDGHDRVPQELES